MMKLHWSPRSPFVRKVMIALHETGLLDEVELVRSVVAVHLPPNSAVLTDNPLGKIPTLVTEQGQAVFDSRVICEYLDMKAGTELFSADPAARFNQLVWQALGDGLTDILLLWRTELTRESGAWTAVTEGWHAKVRASMAQLEEDAEALAAAPFGIGHIAVICALGQLDFRWPDCAWRDFFPKLSMAEKDWAACASVRATAIFDDQDSNAGEVTTGQLRFTG
ncbi:glutathione S-transferase N-terminal domain-containing protein [Saccharospirillum sp.]|uniref:glutathione S-transferase N-terminal domain-containing protein n=1 Tax=Saccharospirillum sp. TaxID=2033801 RepID=UPI0034A034A0